jgi:alkylresorcinol/alkylpyrone synthase
MAYLPRLRAIATAVPPYSLDQEDVARRARAVYSHEAVVQRLMPVFQNSGIERRYSCVPIEWYYEDHGWPDRNAVYLDSAVTLLEQVTRSVLERARMQIENIDAIVVVSTTGIATPSLDALLMERMPFKRTVCRLPIFGLGCAGGTLGLARAATLAREYGTVLLLVIELCAISFRRDDTSKSNIVATALFGDGAAAAILTMGEDGPAIAASGEYLFEDSLDVMGWEVTGDGLKAIFSRDIPSLVETRFREIIERYLGKHGLRIQDVDRFISHPGGMKVLAALEHVFGIADGELSDSRAILRDYGNMSSATVMFVLERALSNGSLSDGTWKRALITSMGPGFTAALVTLER